MDLPDEHYTGIDPVITIYPNQYPVNLPNWKIHLTSNLGPILLSTAPGSASSIVHYIKNDSNSVELYQIRWRRMLVPLSKLCMSPTQLLKHFMSANTIKTFAKFLQELYDARRDTLYNS